MPTIPPIKCGIFQFNTTDYHAILGAPIGASPENIRKQYLKITRLLFPDVRTFKTKEEEKLADQLLSKLVNPSYESLFKSKSARKEHLLVLEDIGSRSAQVGIRRLKSKAAFDLLEASSKGDIDITYRKYLNSIARKEYQDINKALERIALISEFNLVYLMVKSGQLVIEKVVEPEPVSPSTVIQQPVGDKSTEEPQERLTPEERAARWVEPYLRRGKQFIDKRDYAKAIMELREALGHDPKNSQAHAFLGLAHVKQGQLGMAKVHLNKALSFDPKNEMALKGKRVLAEKEKTNSSNEKSKDKGGGLLDGLFGRKKNN